MGLLQVRNEDRGALLGDRVRLADSYLTRLRGLLGTQGLESGQGLLISPSRGVHMFGMRYPLDVLLLDEAQRVKKCYVGLEPGKATGMHRGVRYALELPVGTIESTQTQEGDEIRWTPS
jgi:uncharacterized protein